MYAPDHLCFEQYQECMAPDRLCFKQYQECMPHMCFKQYQECMPQIVCVLNSIKNVCSRSFLCSKQYQAQTIWGIHSWYCLEHKNDLEHTFLILFKTQTIWGIHSWYCLKHKRSGAYFPILFKTQTIWGIHSCFKQYKKCMPQIVCDLNSIKNLCPRSFVFWTVSRMFGPRSFVF
jgi:hypothetical protein